MPCSRAPGSGPTIPNAFTNWAQDVSAAPQQFFQPNSVDELVAIVRQAEDNRLTVRAVGSGWSFTDVMVSPDYMVNTDLLNRTLSETLTGTDYFGDPIFAALIPAARTKRLLYHVEAGVKVHDLHDRLERIPGGISLNDGPGGQPNWHGYALKTLGGSGGQSIIGAVSTSTHGGDDHDNLTNEVIRPLPDMVQAIHLVGAGGAEFFIQRGGQNAIVDVAALGELMPCVAGAGQIISDDDAFNAAVVAVGRMGIVYSVVLEVRRQYFLEENVRQDTWGHVSSLVLLGQHSASKTTIADLRPANRFLQVLILPYPNSDGDRTCLVTTRNEVLPTGPGDAPGKGVFDYVCDSPPAVVMALLGATIAGLIAIAAESGLLSLIPIVGPLLAGVDVAAAALAVAILAPLLSPNTTIGDCLAGLENVISQIGMFGWASGLVNSILGSFLSPGTHTDLSYKIMDTYDYQAKCYKALSMEVAFNADDTAYVDYIHAVFEKIDNYAAQNIVVGAYISLRYCGGSQALLAIEQWPHTVCIEISALGGLAHDAEILAAFELEAANRGAAVHWGQINNRSRPDIEARFPGIDRWRAVLARVSAKGSTKTFDNGFCQQRGLEIYGAKLRRDLSYLLPLLTVDSARGVSSVADLLLDDRRRAGDLTWLEPLLGSAKPRDASPATAGLEEDGAAKSSDLSYLLPLL
jgi:hypothetical protein